MKTLKAFTKFSRSVEFQKLMFKVRQLLISKQSRSADITVQAVLCE